MDRATFTVFIYEIIFYRPYNFTGLRGFSYKSKYDLTYGSLRSVSSRCQRWLFLTQLLSEVGNVKEDSTKFREETVLRRRSPDYSRSPRRSHRNPNNNFLYGRQLTVPKFPCSSCVRRKRWWQTKGDYYSSSSGVRPVNQDHPRLSLSTILAVHYHSWPPRLSLGRVKSHHVVLFTCTRSGLTRCERVTVTLRRSPSKDTADGLKSHDVTFHILI